MKILVIGETNVAPYTKIHFDQIKKTYPKAVITHTDDPEEVNSELLSTEVIITSPFHQHLIDLDLAKKLKWVHVSSAGVTDIAKLLAPTKILLTNSSGVHPIPISETVLGYMLMFGRRLNVAFRNQIVNKSWSRDPGQVKGFELKGATIGIVGMGRIGSELAKICEGIGMKIVSTSHKDGKANLVRLLRSSDFVVNCLPLTDKTQGYFSEAKFKHMKPNSYFINIGRGKTVVEKDLIEALKSNRIAGAALDVFETEPLPNTSPLWKLDNVILTPHVSGWTPYYTDRVIDIFCENLKGFLKGTKMSTQVDKKRGY